MRPFTLLLLTSCIALPLTARGAPIRVPDADTGRTSAIEEIAVACGPHSHYVRAHRGRHHRLIRGHCTRHHRH